MKSTKDDLINQLRIEHEAGLENYLALKAELREKDALIRMLVRGFMAAERLKQYEKDSEDVPF